MKKQAWLDLLSPEGDPSAESVACDLERTLSLVSKFEETDRSRCLTFSQQRDEEEDGQVPDHDRVGFCLSFGDKPSSSQGHSKCSIEVDLVNPSGYNILLTVPLFFLGIIPRPLNSVAQYETVQAAASGEHLNVVIKALFDRPEKHLFRWAQTQPYVEPI